MININLLSVVTPPHIHHNVLSYETIVISSPIPASATHNSLPTSYTFIVGSVFSHPYIASEATFQNSNPTSPRVCLDSSNGCIEQSASTDNLTIPQMIKSFHTNEHIIASLNHTVVGLGPIFDANFTVIFSKKDATVFPLRKNPPS